MLTDKKKKKTTPSSRKSTASTYKSSSSYSSGAPARAALAKEERAIKLADARTRRANLTQPTKSESRKSASAAKNQFKKINKNQAKSTAASKKRQNTNTGGVQDRVDKMAKVCSSKKSCGEQKAALKKIAKKSAISIPRKRAKAAAKKKKRGLTN